MSALTTTSPPCVRIASRLASRVGDARFNRYFAPSARLRYDGQALAVHVSSPFAADWLQRQFGTELRDAAVQESCGRPVEIQWHITPDEFGAAELNEQAVRLHTGDTPRPATPAPRRHPGPVLRHRLDEFVVGDSNRLAFKASLRLAGGDNEGGPFGVLFIHGPSGVGKTHLLQGIATSFAEARPGSRARYVTAEQFTNEYIASIGSGGIEAFRRRYRGLDLLCIDDVHFLGGKTKTQDEFLHTFDTLDLGGARVALASDEHPRQLQRLSSHITSRFVSGMVVRVDPPDAATRLALARLIAARRGLPLDEDALAVVIATSRGSVRELEGALLRVEALARVMEPPTGDTIPSSLVRRALAESATNLRKPLRLGAILSGVCQTLRVEASEVLGNCRHKRVVLARAVAAYLAREMTTHSFPEIARALGRRNHSTIVTACQRIAGRLKNGAPCDDARDIAPTLEALLLRLRADITASA